MGEKKLEDVEPNETGTQIEDHQAWCEEKHGMEFGDTVEKTDSGDDESVVSADKVELSRLEKAIAALKGKKK